MKRLITLLFITISLSASAQKVVDAEHKEPIVGAVVQLLNSDYTPVSYTTTDSDGCFKPFTKSGDYLKFSCMNYRTDTIAMANLPSVIKMTSQPMQIREISVVAPKIRMRGDTLSYIVASFADNTDRTIGDVLGKMPGVEVAESGQIKYNGKDINKFYIEGTDMMDSRYGIATNSISFNDVAAVEIMENHQSVKALEDISFSDKAAINIKLKESAKAKWSGSAELGGGYPNLYSGNAVAMSFSKKSQTINTLKANNTGVDVTSEVAVTSISDLLLKEENGGSISDYILISPTQLSNVNNTFGNNESMSSNFLYKLSEESNIKGNITLSNSNFSYQTESLTEYFIQDNTISIEENESTREHSSKASANFTLTSNAKDFYLRNTLDGDLSNSQISMATLGTYPNEQFGSIILGDISNNFELIKRIGDNTINISSYNGYSSKPQELNVVDGFNEAITAAVFSSHTKASYGFKLLHWTLFARTGVNYYTQQINSSEFDYLKFYLNPHIEYRSRKGVVFSVNTPLSYYMEQGEFMPSVSSYLKVPLSARWEVTANAGAGEDKIGNKNFYSEALQGDYRTITYGVSEFLPATKLYGSLGFAYKEPITLLFANGSLGYSSSTNPYTSVYDYQDEYTIYSFAQQESHSSSTYSELNVGKGFRGGRVSIGASYSISEGEYLLNDELVKYQIDKIGSNLKTNYKFTQWLSAEYTGAFLKSILENASSSSWHLTQSGQITLTPTKGLNITASGNHLWSEDSDLLLVGAMAQWQISPKWELSFEATNLLDESHYTIENLSSTQFTSTKYSIRPRALLLCAKVVL